MRIPQKTKEAQYKKEETRLPTSDVIDLSSFVPTEQRQISLTDALKQITNRLEATENGLYVSGPLRSPNFVRKTRGWGLNVVKDGDAYFVDGYFAGTFAIGGATMTVGNVNQIQSALDEIDASGGGTVFLKAGTYVLTADISVPSGVTLEGVSAIDVILDCNSAYKVQMVGSDAYSTGTVTISDGDTEVVGDSTVWTSAMIGRHIMLDGYWYLITARTDNTHITIDSAYYGDNLTLENYVLATVNDSPTIRNLTIQNATAEGFKVQYTRYALIDNIYVWDSGTGIDDSDSVYSRYLVEVGYCGTGMIFNNTWGFSIDFSALYSSSVGGGFEATNSGSGTITDSIFDDNATDGARYTDCENIATFSVNFYNNGSQGIELVSGCNDMQFIAVACKGNASDGIKLTATSDRAVIAISSINDNGGYGINIAASTCDNNQIIGVAYDNNTSGSLNNSGTRTIQLYATIASDNLRDSASTERNTSSITYVKVKEILFNETDGTVRVKFDLKNGGASLTSYGRIYKNGVAYGTEQSNNTSTYQTFSEDLTFKTGDLIQLYYHKSDGGDNAYVRNFQLYYDKALVTNTGTVNTD